MKLFRSSRTTRVAFGSFALLMLIAAAIVDGFRASASNDFNSDSTQDESVSVRLLSRNSAAINLRPGRDLPTEYKSSDYSSYQL